MGLSSNAVSTSGATESPYKLDIDQTLKASTALLAHIKKETERLKAGSAKRNLLPAQDDESENEGADGDLVPIWLNFNTKKHLVDKKRLKPGKLAVPHSLNASPSLRICLITADPQRAAKDAVEDPAFPSELRTRIAKIIGFTKLRDRYKSFESRRQLLAEHDIFFADDRILSRLIETLGKTFYKGLTKRPIPVNIARVEKVNGKTVKQEKTKSKDEKYAAVASPGVVAKEIERALNAVPVSLKPGTSSALKIGDSSFTPKQLTDNIQAVVQGMIDKYVVKGWRNIKAIHIKGPRTAALPIWLADDLWTDEGDVVEDVKIEEKKSKGSESPEKVAKKRKSVDGAGRGGENKVSKKAKKS